MSTVELNRTGWEEATQSTALQHLRDSVAETQREVQRSLLPSAMPCCPAITFATRYVPAEYGGVGGDWYDAFLLPSGDLWVMVGDVAGHGLGAATVMGRLRSALRSYAMVAEGGPEEVLALADAKLQFFEPGRMATVLCTVLRPPYDSIRIASAGHLPPVLAIPGGPTSVLELAVSPPLGVVTKTDPHTVEFDLPRGAVLVGYTDGLIERRGESLDQGFARLAASVKVADPELVCRDTMDALVGSDIPSDDIAVIALRRTAT